MTAPNNEIVYKWDHSVDREENMRRSLELIKGVADRYTPPEPRTSEEISEEYTRYVDSYLASLSTDAERTQARDVFCRLREAMQVPS